MKKDDIPLYNLTLAPVDGELEAYGFDKIAYVPNPAMEEMGVYLASIDGVDIDKKVLEDEVINYLKSVGVKQPDNWIPMTEDEYNKAISKTSILQLTNDPTSRESVNDFTVDNGQWLVRYRYYGPTDSKNRNFCQELLSIDRLYTEEEIKNGLFNDDFGYYDIFDYKGSYGCRHRWKREIFFEDYLKDNVRNMGYTPEVVSKLNDSNATNYNALLATEIKLSSLEKQQVVAPLLIPDKVIDRNDKNGKYKIVFSKEVIVELRDRATKDGRLKSLDIMKDTHRGNRAPSFIIEDWIIEDENDRAYKEYGFSELKVPIGTWMVITQVIDKDYWENEIKKNRKYAYSIEAFLNMKMVNLKLSKMEKQEDKGLKLSLPVGEYEINGKLYNIDENGVISEIAVEVLAEDEVKKDEEIVAEDEVKKEEEVVAEDTEIKEEIVEEVKAEDEVIDEKVEEVVAEDVEVKEDEEIKAEDEKWEAVYEEIAEIKAMIKGLKEVAPEDANVELSNDVYSSIMALKKQRINKRY